MGAPENAIVDKASRGRPAPTAPPAVTGVPSRKANDPRAFLVESVERECFDRMASRGRSRI